MTIDTNTTAAAAFYKACAEFSERTKPWEQRITYYTTADEAWDVTLISDRVYGNRFETLAILAAAGLDTAEQEIPIRQLVLPTPTQLYAIKRRSGYESNPDYRENFAPTWAQ